jgi:predicted transcriptional regulator
MDVTPCEIEIIFELIEEPKSVKELANKLGIDESTAYKSVGKLYKMKILGRVRVQNGGRKTFVYYSKMGILIDFLKSRVNYWRNVIEKFKLES